MNEPRPTTEQAKAALQSLKESFWYDPQSMAADWFRTLDAFVAALDRPPPTPNAPPDDIVHHSPDRLGRHTCGEQKSGLFSTDLELVTCLKCLRLLADRPPPTPDDGVVCDPVEFGGLARGFMMREHYCPHGNLYAGAPLDCGCRQPQPDRPTPTPDDPRLLSLEQMHATGQLTDVEYHDALEDLGRGTLRNDFGQYDEPKPDRPPPTQGEWEALLQRVEEIGSVLNCQMFKDSWRLHRDAVATLRAALATKGPQMYDDPNCRYCQRPLVMENAWMGDGCPCNSPAGTNKFNELRWELLHQLQQREHRELAELKAAAMATREQRWSLDVPEPKDTPLTWVTYWMPKLGRWSKPVPMRPHIASSLNDLFEARYMAAHAPEVPMDSDTLGLLNGRHAGHLAGGLSRQRPDFKAAIARRQVPATRTGGAKGRQSKLVGTKGLAATEAPKVAEEAPRVASTLERTFETRKWRFDFAFPEQKVAVELEGGTWTGGRHVRPKGFQGDCDKHNAAQLAGWRVFRFTADDLRKQPVQCCELVAAALATPRGASEAT